MDFELLKKLINQNSFTKNKEGVDAVGQMLKEELDFMDVEEYDHQTIGNLLVFKSKGWDDSKPKVLLSGHMDTVHPEDLDFQMKEDGNKLYGPGTIDMKAGLFVIVETLKELNKNGNLKNVTFTAVPDEEAGSDAHKENLVEIYKEQDYAMVYESTADTLQEEYSPNRRTVVVSRKGMGKAVFEIEAPGGHSGVLTKKDERISALHEAAQKILAIEDLADYEKQTTTNPGTITGGTTFNTIPRNAKLEVDYRIMLPEERIRIRKAYEDLANKNFIEGTKTTIKWEYDIPPMPYTDETKEFADLVRKSGEKSGIEVVDEKRGGGSDGNQMAAVGVKYVLDGFGPQGAGDHTTQEFVYLDSIEPSIKLSVAVLTDLLK